MKWLLSILPTSLFMIGITTNVLAQDPREAEIRRLENLERESVLKTDSAVLYDKLWSPKMVVNTPANIVGTVEGTKQLLRTGGLKYFIF